MSKRDDVAAALSADADRTLRAVADEVGCSHEYVRLLRTEMRLPPRRRRNPYDPEPDLVAIRDGAHPSELDSYGRLLYWRKADAANEAEFRAAYEAGYTKRSSFYDDDGRLRRCVGCGEYKDPSEFHRGSRPDGLNYRCKPCNGAQARQWFRQNRGRTPVPTVTERRCGRCGITKPADEFWRRTSSHDGLQSYCKDCWRTFQPQRA